jgi:(2Fe-2S) ferredoxin
LKFGRATTSALTARGIAEVGKAVIGQIKWDDLSKTSRPRLFQLIREIVDDHQKRGEVVMLHQNDPDVEFDPKSVDTVVGQLAGQGEIVERLQALTHHEQIQK